MEGFTKVSSSMIRSKDMGASPGRMEEDTWEIGKLENNTEEVSISYQTDSRRLDSGTKVKRFVG